MNVLFVEDDLQLQTIMVEEIMLEIPDINITTANNGAQALQIVAKAKERFDVVITDHNLGDMEGTHLSLKLRELDPDFKIILISGFFFDDTVLYEQGSFYKVISKLENDILLHEIRVLANQHQNKI